MKPARLNRPAARAFTLIEMLTVIAIIGILAGLIVTGASLAGNKARQNRVESERDALVTAIQSYKEHQGYYPPDNNLNGVLNPLTNTLFYELTGAKNSNGVFYAVNTDFFNSGQLQNIFNVGGILNSSADTNEPSKNYFSATAKGNRTVSLVSSGANFTLFAIPVPGPTYSVVSGSSGPQFNLWNYVSSAPTNNPGSFDLWMDVIWGGKTNRVSNWSKNPQVL